MAPAECISAPRWLRLLSVLGMWFCYREFIVCRCFNCFSLSLEVRLCCAVFGDYLINVRRLLLYFGCALVVMSVFVVFWFRDVTTTRTTTTDRG